MAETKISELGLAEFVAGLISETFEAVSVSMESQLMRQAEFIGAAELTLKDYAERYVPEDAVDQACCALFATDNGVNPIISGGAYTPGNADTEIPPIQRELGIVLKTPDDYRKKGAHVQFTKSGVDRIRNELALRAASYHQEALRLLLSKGLPRIIIDSGRILSKITFKINESASGQQPATTSEPTGVKALDSNTIAAFKKSLVNRLGKTRKNLLLPNTQLLVKPVSDDKAQSSTTNVYGEVEISFKTVT